RDCSTAFAVPAASAIRTRAGSGSGCTSCARSSPGTAAPCTSIATSTRARAPSCGCRWKRRLEDHARRRRSRSARGHRVRVAASRVRGRESRRRRCGARHVRTRATRSRRARHQHAADQRDPAAAAEAARCEESDVVRALGLGADDYLTKPFSPKILIARVRALVRRAGAAATESVEAGALSLDVTERTLLGLPRGPIRLTPLELRFLQLLFAHAGRTVPTERLLVHVWGN